jgi:hypothetical protein
MRTEFLKMAMGATDRMTKALVQLSRNKTRLTTTLAMNNAIVDRIPLHCGATSISTPGKDITIPRLKTGT